MQPALLGSDFALPLDRPFSYQQARAAGVTRHQLQRLVEEGLVRRMLPGVYAAAQLPDTQLTRARAIKLVVPSGHVITDESAGWLLGADMILEPNAHLRVPQVRAFAVPGHHRLRNDLVKSGSRTLLARDVVEVHGLPVTTALRTAIDLGRLRHRDRGSARSTRCSVSACSPVRSSSTRSAASGACAESDSCARWRRSRTGGASHPASPPSGCASTTEGCPSRRRSRTSTPRPDGSSDEAIS